jgi:hypothetical protein
MARDTHRDLVACFAWKQVRLGFPNFASKLVEERRWVVHVASLQRSSEGPNPQLSSVPGSCYLVDHTGGIRDPDDARQRDPY